MAELLEELRPRAFAIAYRMLGSVGDAEDIVQEALVRLHAVLEAGEEIEVPEAYLATVVTRLGIDRLRSAQVRRETYVGEWLPEPVVTGGLDDPATHAEMSDSLSLAFIVLLERLSPEQRAVFLLREVFDYGYDTIAEIVGKSEDACRQLAVRARRHVDQDRPRFEASRQEHNELALKFMAAAQTGDLDGLEALLAHDVALHGDGGGKARSPEQPLFGRRRVARTLLSWMQVVGRIEGFSIRPAEVNGQPAVLNFDGQQRIVSVWSLDIADNQIQAVRSIVNPDKLRHLGPLADLPKALTPRSSPTVIEHEPPDP
jgi:RNA polymerase sigma-70 factor (TIGR02957 family)